MRSDVDSACERRATLRNIAVAVDHLSAIPEGVAVVGRVVDGASELCAGVVVRVAVPEILVRVVCVARSIVGRVDVEVRRRGLTLAAAQRARQRGAVIGTVSGAIQSEVDCGCTPTKSRCPRRRTPCRAPGFAADALDDDLVRLERRPFGSGEIDGPRRRHRHAGEARVRLYERQCGASTDVVLTETRRKLAACRAVDCIDRALRIGVYDQIAADDIESVELLAIAMMATTAAIPSGLA